MVKNGLAIVEVTLHCLLNFCFGKTSPKLTLFCQIFGNILEKVHHQGTINKNRSYLSYIGWAIPSHVIQS